MVIPLIDIADFDGGSLSTKQEIARQWGKAFETVGFASIVGHGISETLISDIYTEARRFFDLPHDLKMQCYDQDMRKEGFSPMGQEAVGRSAGGAAPIDLCQSIQFVNLHLGEDRPRHWPHGLRQIQTVVSGFVVAAAELERKLMRITAVSLDLEEDYFDPYSKKMTTKLRLVDYPDQPMEPAPGQLRNAAHTDFGGFTILRQDDAPGGLQVRLLDADWVDVKPIPGALVINAGDLIQRWTNDRFHSNLHRVINPPRHLTGSTRRLSIVVFTGPNPDTLITPLPTCLDDNGAKYPPILSSAHTLERERLAYLASG